MINGNFAILILGIFTLLTVIMLAKRFSWKFREIVKFVVISGTYIMYITATLFPMPTFYEDVEVFGEVNFIPFKTMIEYINSALNEGMWELAVYQILGNILLFYVVMLITIWYTKIDSFKSFIVWLLIFSIGAEALQGGVGLILGFLYRSVDIDDVLLYIIGGLLAYVTIRISKGNKRKSDL